MLNTPAVTFLTLLLTLSTTATATAKHPGDTHYSSIGFFDIHVCNWPDRPPFIMGVFSSTKFNSLKSVELFSPANTSLGFLDLTKFRQFKTKQNNTKKAFIKQFKIPDISNDGWYKALITLKNNKTIIAKDFVHHSIMPISSPSYPGDHASDIKLPKKLEWTAAKGAKYYQIFIRDLWQDGKTIYKSKLLTENQLLLPQGLLQHGGLYSWKIHARDINEDIKLGDFNHGSLSDQLTFSIEDK